MIKAWDEMTIIMGGIKACRTVKKARDWLDGHNLVYDVRDYKLAGADPGRLLARCEEFRWKAVLNRAGTTFRKLSEGEKEKPRRRKNHKFDGGPPTMIKRPIVETGTRRLIGVKPELSRCPHQMKGDRIFGDLDHFKLHRGLNFVWI